MRTPLRNERIKIDDEYHLIFAQNPFDHEKVMIDGINEYSKSDDSKINGESHDAKELLLKGLSCYAFELIIFRKTLDNSDVGMHVISADFFTRGRSILGHVLYVTEDHRKMGLWSKHLSIIDAVCSLNGCNKFEFMSCLPVWDDRAPKNNFILTGLIKQSNGPDVKTWARMVE